MNEYWGTVSMNELLWCDVEWNIMIRLLIEPDIFSKWLFPYLMAASLFWFVRWDL